jgi:hypothetical protein
LALTPLFRALIGTLSNEFYGLPSSVPDRFAGSVRPDRFASPELLGPEDVRTYQVYLINQKRASSSWKMGKWGKMETQSYFRENL